MIKGQEINFLDVVGYDINNLVDINEKRYIYFQRTKGKSFLGELIKKAEEIKISREFKNFFLYKRRI